MSTTTPSTNKQVYKVLPLVTDVEFTEGVSSKSGNAYLVGAVYIKSALSDSPIRLGFEYIDPNTRELIKLSIKRFADEQTDDFAKDIKE
jgi:hypothetical protein